MAPRTIRNRWLYYTVKCLRREHRRRLRCAESSSIITRRHFIHRYMPYLIRRVPSIGRTPHQTLSNTLQKLRNADILQFVGRGQYRLRDEDVATRYERDLVMKQSCSSGERTVQHVLDELALSYECEQCLPNLVYRRHLKLDFYVQSPRGRAFIIEYDGVQHFQPVTWFGGEEEHKKTIARDTCKNTFAWQHNIPLLRIPYTEQSLRVVKAHINRFVRRLDHGGEGEIIASPASVSRLFSIILPKRLYCSNPFAFSQHVITTMPMTL